jgi:hypothetical protein
LTVSAKPVLGVVLGLSALSLTQPSPAAVQPGTYEGNQTEIAAALQLQPNGRFRYALSYGALDERAEGRWEEKDGAVLLTTEPQPKPPAFPVVSDTPSPDGKVYASLEKAEELGLLTLTLLVRYEGAHAFDYVEADETGLVPVPAGARIAELVPSIPAVLQVAEPHKLTPGGHKIVFRFEPNDLGIADFRAERLAIDGAELRLRRHDRDLRFRKTP